MMAELSGTRGMRRVPSVKGADALDCRTREEVRMLSLCLRFAKSLFILFRTPLDQRELSSFVPVDINFFTHFVDCDFVAVDDPEEGVASCDSESSVLSVEVVNTSLV